LFAVHTKWNRSSHRSKVTCEACGKRKLGNLLRGMASGCGHDSTLAGYVNVNDVDYEWHEMCPLLEITATTDHNHWALLSTP
jgi:hypothetical protein